MLHKHQAPCIIWQNGRRVLKTPLFFSQESRIATQSPQNYV